MTSEVTPISEREREILRLVAMGATNQQIAQQLHISINTVKVHLRNIFEKIGVASRTEATVYAIRQGLVQLDGSPAPAPATLTTATSDPPSALPDPPSTSSILDSELAVALAPELGSSVSSGEVPAPTPIVSITPEAVLPVLPEPRRRVWLWPLLVLAVLVVAGLAYVLLQRWSQPVVAPPQATAVAVQPTRWKSHAAWPQVRTNFAVAAYDGKVYTIGGSAGSGASAAVDRFDPEQDQWVSLNDKPTAVTHVQGVTIGGRIYVPGGEGVDGSVQSVFEAYDPRNKQWESLPDLPQPRSRYALAVFEGKLYLFGGWDGATARKEVFEYDPASRRWAERAPLPTARSNAGAAVFQDYIYVIGGENQQGPLRVNERFDPTGSGGSEWTSAVPLAAAIAQPAVVGALDGVLVFDSQLHTATQYTPARDSWAMAVPIPSGIAVSPRALPLGTSIFFFGQPDGSPPGAVSEYQANYQTLFPVVGTGQ